MKRTKKTTPPDPAPPTTNDGILDALRDAGIAVDEAAVSRVSTGIPDLDEVLGGGVAKGRIIEVFGPESAGKTTLALTLASALAADDPSKSVVYIDAEHAVSPDQIRRLFPDTSRFVLVQPDSLEDAFNAVSKVLQTGKRLASVFVIDSIAALSPKAEIDGETGEMHVGLHARLIGASLRRVKTLLAREESVLICINQLRSKIGVMFGNPETTPGGNALKFYASHRLDVRIDDRGGMKSGIGDSKPVSVGNVISVKAVKNKVGEPYKQCLLNLRWGAGVEARNTRKKKEVDE